MSFLRQLLIYGIASAASRLVGVVLVPLYTHALTMREYGTFEVLLALYLLAVLVTGWQSESGLARDYQEAVQGGWERQLTWSSLMISIGGFGLTATIVLILYLAGAVPGVLAPYLPWVLALVLPTQIFNLQLIVLRFSHRPITFTIFSIADLVVSAVASIVFVIWCRFGIVGALAGLLVGKSLASLVAWSATFGRVPRPPSRETPLRLLRYGTPTMVPVLLNWAQRYGSGILLALFLTLSDVGIAGIAMKIAAVFEIAALSFRQAWDPFAFGKLGDQEAAQTVFRRALAFYIVLMGAGAGAVVLVAPLGARLFAPPAYALAAAVAGPFVLAQLWVGTVSILAIGILAARRTSLIAYSYLAGSVLNVVTVVLLGPRLGIVAAGAGAMVGAIITALAAAYFSGRTYAIRFDWRLLITASIATGGFAAITYVVRAPIEPLASWLPFPPDAVCAAAYLAMVALLALAGAREGLGVDVFACSKGGKARLAADEGGGSTSGM